jgi:YtcA family
MKPGILKPVAATLVLLVIAFLAVQLFGHHSPTVDVLGSYFPAWMVCILSGLALTFVAHWIVQVCGLKTYIGPTPLVYPSLMIIFTFATWILFYQN